MHELLIIFLFNQFSRAELDCRCRIENLTQVADLGFKLKKLKWNPVDDKQVKNAPCKTKAPPEESQMSSFLEEKKQGSLDSETINGIQFENEDVGLLNLFKKLNAPNANLGNPILLNFHSQCKKVLCAVKEIFGSRQGIRLLYLLEKYDFNGSNLRDPETRAWTAKELDQVLTIVSDLPDEIFPIEENRPLCHYKRDSNPALGIANSNVMVFDAWNKRSVGGKANDLIHELGHAISEKQQLDKTDTWRSFSGWKAKGDLNSIDFRDWEMGDESKATSDYGKSTPTEDFAESVVSYRYDGAYLKKLAPDKYDYIRKNVFHGIEYDSEVHCNAHLTAH